MKNWIFTLFIVSCFFSCNSEKNKQTGLRNNPTIKDFFNQYQGEDLEKILHFFEAEICISEQVTTDSPVDCYRKYFGRLAEAEGFGKLPLSISLAKEDSLINSLYKVTYKAIWSDGKSPENSNPTGGFGLKYGGGFQRYLNVLAEENEKVRWYAELFQAKGYITPIMVADVLINYETYDLTDERIRLMLAVHYLTLNKG